MLDRRGYTPYGGGERADKWDASHDARIGQCTFAATTQACLFYRKLSLR